MKYLKLFEKFHEKCENIQESHNDDTYENIIFLQGDEAEEVLAILDEQGEDAAMEYLKQWHNHGEHEGSDNLGHGSSDYTFEKDGYIMSWNNKLGYISLQYEFPTEEFNVLEEDEEVSNFISKVNRCETCKGDGCDDCNGMGCEHTIDDDNF